MRYIISFFFCTIFLFGFNYSLKPYKIIDGVHCFFGLPSEVSHSNGGNMVNSCYIETKDGYIVIDSGPTYQYAQASYTIMEKIKKIPVKYVINTSSDEVHILGSDFYKEQGALIFGPKNYQKYFSEKQQQLTLSTKLSKDVFFNTRLIPLDRYINKDMTLVCGDIIFDIKPIKNDSKHLVVFFPQKKILFSGDMIFNNRIIPLKKRSLLVWEKALAELTKLDWKDTVSSHGLMTRRSAFKKTETYLTLLKNQVEESLTYKESKSEAINRILLPSFREDKLYSVWHPQNVASVYDELSTKIRKTTSVDIEKNISIKENKQYAKPIKVDDINYLTFRMAMSQAKKDKKIVLLKIRSTTCKYCDRLDKILSKNNKVKKILNQYFKVVKLNSDYDSIPLSLNIQSTPMLVFINPQNRENLMQIAGIQALGEILEVLQEAIDDGYNGGYLKK